MNGDPRDRAALSQALAEWLPGQPWYAVTAARGRDPAARGDSATRPRVEVVSALTVLPGDPSLVILIVREAPDAGSDVAEDCRTFQLPLARHGGVGRDTPADAIVLPDGYLTEGSVEAPLMTGLLRLLATGATVDAGPDGSVDLRPEPGAEIDPGQLPAPLGVSQRNTAVVFGERHILKFFRRITTGPNPQVELVRALAAAGNRGAPLHLATVTATLADGRSFDLGALQEFIPSGTDGWQMATTSARDLFSEGDLQPADVGGDFASEARRLGAVTASVHQDLAAAFGESELGRDAVLARIGRTRRRCEAACDEVPALAVHRDGLLARLDAAGDAVCAVPAQRIHGDLGLTEVLRTDRGWVVIDFEGDPCATVADRRRMRSPMRDVAGMLRSLDYAARHLLVGMTGDGQLTWRAREWVTHNRRAFLDGYASVRGISPDERAMLEVFEFDKAVDEVVGEARYRPGWLSVPLSFLSDRLENRDG